MKDYSHSFYSFSVTYIQTCSSSVSM